MHYFADFAFNFASNRPARVLDLADFGRLPPAPLAAFFAPAPPPMPLAAFFAPAPTPAPPAAFFASNAVLLLTPAAFFNLLRLCCLYSILELQQPPPNPSPPFLPRCGFRSAAAPPGMQGRASTASELLLGRAAAADMAAAAASVEGGPGLGAAAAGSAAHATSASARAACACALASGSGPAVPATGRGSSSSMWRESAAQSPGSAPFAGSPCSSPTSSNHGRSALPFLCKPTLTGAFVPVARVCRGQRHQQHPRL